LVGSAIVRVLYSDESMTETREPITVVAAIMLNMDAQWMAVRDAVEGALGEVMTGDRIARYEIKGQKLFHDLAAKRPDATTLLRRLCSIPTEQLIPIFFGAVDRIGYEALSKRFGEKPESRGQMSKHCQAVAFVSCAAHADGYIHRTSPSERILWIADKGNAEERLKDGLRQYQKIRAIDLKEGRPYLLTSEPRLDHVADTIYFGHSHESRALQLADLYCSTITRHLSGDTTAEPFFNLIGPQLIGGPAVFADVR
jgi:hypothetical protein